MSICNPCTIVLPVPYCATNIWVGDWSADGVALYVYTMNTATGYISKESVTSGTDGKISITFPNRVANASYEVWVNTDESMAFAKESFDLPDTSTAVTCLSVRFERVEESGAADVIAEAKLST